MYTLFLHDILNLLWSRVVCLEVFIFLERKIQFYIKDKDFINDSCCSKL
jgi:hypothetical protein